MWNLYSFTRCVMPWQCILKFQNIIENWRFLPKICWRGRIEVGYSRNRTLQAISLLAEISIGFLKLRHKFHPIKKLSWELSTRGSRLIRSNSCKTPSTLAMSDFSTFHLYHHFVHYRAFRYPLQSHSPFQQATRTQSYYLINLKMTSPLPSIEASFNSILVCGHS